MDCLFCKIARGEFNTTIIDEDETVLAFNDIAPQAPHHVLIIPKKHIATTNDLCADDQLLIGHMILTAQKIAQQLKIQQDGYRIVMNCNSNGGQAVYHIHLHLLGGRQMNWPPG